MKGIIWNGNHGELTPDDSDAKKTTTECSSTLV